MSCSRALAQFAADLTLAKIPAEVVATARLHLLDTVGVCLASVGMDYASAILEVVREHGGRPEATILGQRDRAAASWAALYNGALAHGSDFDDTHSLSAVHASGIVMPTVLALGERCSASGAEVLAAAIAGYEVGIRIGMAMPGALHSRGFHPTGVYGAFAAAASAGRVLRLDPDRLTHALGIAASQASGLMEFLTDGAWTKRIHLGWAAHSGTLAALLAARGYTGPATALEGRFGLYSAFAAPVRPDLSRVTAGLGTDWETLNLEFKPYPCGHISHPYMDCARSLRTRYALAPDAIESIELRVAPGAVPIVCEPLDDKRRPANSYAARFSLPYGVAAVLVLGGAGIDDFSEERIRDSRILALTARTTYVIDDALPFPRHFPGWVRLRLKDGREVEERTDSSRGSRANPMRETDVFEKFAANVGRARASASAAAIWEAGLRLEALPDIASFTSLLAPRATPSRTPGS